MNKQEAFEKALLGVLRQKRGSIDNGKCAYKLVLDDGRELRCAVGHLLTDEQMILAEKNSDFTAAYLASSLERRDIPLDSQITAEPYFLRDLQQTHDAAARSFPGGDHEFMETFKESMKYFAERWSLTFPEGV